MILTDPVYGEFNVTEPVILELLEEPAVLRVAHIMQGGPSVPLNGWKDFSRLEHCIGTMLMVRTLGGSLDEQIAALLHDIPHTAFSHVVDFVFMRSDTQDYHEHIKEKIIADSTIPRILNKYGYDLEFILNENNFPILERKSPALCADRVDYALRAYAYYEKDPVTAKLLFEALRVLNNEIIFDSIEHAVQFGIIFSDFIHHNVSNIRNMATYYILADAIRYALDNSMITEETLLLSDAKLLEKLASFQNEYISLRLNLLVPSLEVTKVFSGDSYTYRMTTKKRWVRPKAEVGGTVVDVFEITPLLQTKYDDYTEWIKEPFYVQVKGI